MSKHRWLPLAVVVGIGLSAAYVVAGPGAAGEHFIPYTGYLEENGQPMGASGTVTQALTFQLFDAATNGALLATMAPQNVAVSNGTFATSIGPVADAAFAAPRLFLQISVGSVVLPARQEVLAVPYAVRGEVGKAFAVGTVNGGTFNGSVNGNLNGDTVTAAHFVTNSGDIALNGGPANPWKIKADNVDALRFTYFGGDRMALQQSNLRVAGSITGNTTPDIAETIPAAADVEAMDVVCADPLRRERAVRCSRAAPALLGVISDGTSTFLINSRAGSVDAPLTGRPLVLAGRVPVKVSLENGPIAIGDQLAPSSVPGVAMRATGPGPVVGIALEALGGAPGTRGSVLCFVKVGEGNVAAALVASDARAAALEKRVGALEARLTVQAARAVHGAR